MGDNASERSMCHVGIVSGIFLIVKGREKSCIECDMPCQP
jgi:hypothetical protein